MPNSIRNILKNLVYKGHMTQEQMDKIVRNLKSQDSVDVVRCRDCKWGGSPSHCPDRYMMMDCDGFCSWGERKE